jgi:hypothetical protein
VRPGGIGHLLATRDGRRRLRIAAGRIASPASCLSVRSPAPSRRIATACGNLSGLATVITFCFPR